MSHVMAFVTGSILVLLLLTVLVFYHVMEGCGMLWMVILLLVVLLAVAIGKPAFDVKLWIMTCWTQLLSALKQYIQQQQQRLQAGGQKVGG